MRIMSHGFFRAALRIGSLVCFAGSLVYAQQSPTDQRGQSVDPFHTASGKPTVLIFLTIDCPISNRYAPTIQALAAKYAGRIAFWLVYPARLDSPTAITASVEGYGYRIPWLRDPDRVLVHKAQATITPEAAVFDADGHLQYHGRIDDLYQTISRARPAPTHHDVDEVLQQILAKQAIIKHGAPAVGCYISDLQ
jgi:thiol-disulfide isomerase/thioredoxin